jgi:hypothetical protein
MTTDIVFQHVTSLLPRRLSRASWRRLVTVEQRRHQLAPAPDAYPVEDRLQVVLDRVRG